MITTDSNGNLKPYGKTAPNLATYGIYVSSSTQALSSSSYTFIVDGLDGLSIAKGDVIKVTFEKYLRSNTAITSVSLNIGGANGIIKTNNGTSTLRNVISHEFTGGNYNSTYKHQVWDAYTTLDLMWTGSEWLIMGNPVLCSYFSTNEGYTVYANGLIEQWGTSTVNNYTTYCGFHIQMQTRFYMVFTPNDSDSHSDSRYGFYNDTETGFYAKSYGGRGNWYAFGY